MGRMYFYTETKEQDLITIVESLGWKTSEECKLKEYYMEDEANRRFCCSKPTSFKVLDEEGRMVVLNGNAGQFDYKEYTRITFDDDTTRTAAIKVGYSLDQYELTETGKRHLADIFIRAYNPALTDNLGRKICDFIDPEWIIIAKDKIKRCSNPNMTFSHAARSYMEDMMNPLCTKALFGDLTEQYVVECAPAFDMFYKAQRFFNRKTIEAVRAVDPRTNEVISNREQFEAYHQRFRAAMDMIYKEPYNTDPDQDLRRILLAKDPDFISKNTKGV